MLAKTDPDSKQAGKYIIIGGLALQLLFFGFFIIVAGIFHSRLLRNPTSRSVSDTVPWKKHMYILYDTSILIMIRSIFRTVEYVQGENGYLLRKELWLYIYDATLMFLVMTLMNVVHPSEVNALLKGRKAVKEVVRTETLMAITDPNHPMHLANKGNRLAKSNEGVEMC